MFHRRHSPFMLEYILNSKQTNKNQMKTKTISRNNFNNSPIKNNKQ